MSFSWDPKVARHVRRSLEDLLDRRVSQTEMAEWMGYSRAAVQGWESGRFVPDKGVQFIYHKLVGDPGFITELRLWSGSIYESGKQQTSQASSNTQA